MIFTAGELIYFVAIWWHLGGFLAPGDSSPDRIYWLAVLIRLCTQGWVVIMVVRDALRPDRIRYRRDGVDDPTGGVLDQARTPAGSRCSAAPRSPGGMRDAARRHPRPQPDQLIGPRRPRPGS